MDSNISVNVADSLNKMSSFLHELAQSLLVIQAYIHGCTERIKHNNLNSKQLEFIFVKLNEHTEIISNKLHSMSESLNSL